MSKCHGYIRYSLVRKTCFTFRGDGIIYVGWLVGSFIMTYVNAWVCALHEYYEYVILYVMCTYFRTGIYVDNIVLCVLPTSERYRSILCWLDAFIHYLEALRGTLAKQRLIFEKLSSKCGTHLPWITNISGIWKRKVGSEHVMADKMECVCVWNKNETKQTQC